MISKNGIRAFSDSRYDYYELMQDLGGIVPAGAIFVHDTDDTENGSIADGCLKLCWTPDGNCYYSKDAVCANTVVFHSLFKDSPMFKKCNQISNKQKEKILRKISDLEDKIKDLREEIE